VQTAADRCGDFEDSIICMFIGEHEPSEISNRCVTHNISSQYILKQDIQKELEIVISFCMFPMFVKEAVEYMCSLAQVCSIQQSSHIISFLV
jgi:hypothetical protein